MDTVINEYNYIFSRAFQKFHTLKQTW